MEKFLILALMLIILLMAITFALTIKKFKADIQEINDSYEYLKNDWYHSTKIIDDINAKYSKSLDERERLLNESNVRIKKLEIEIDKKDAEIAKMQAVIEFAKMKENNDEKEKVEKED